MDMRFSPLKTFFRRLIRCLCDPDRLSETLLRHLKTYEGGGTVHQSQAGSTGTITFRVMEGNARGLGPLPTQPEYTDRQPQVSSRVISGMGQGSGDTFRTAQNTAGGYSLSIDVFWL